MRNVETLASDHVVLILLVPLLDIPRSVNVIVDIRAIHLLVVAKVR